MEHIASFAASGYAPDRVQLFHGAPLEAILPLLADCPVLRLRAGESPPEAKDRQGRLYVVLHGALGVTPAEVRPGGERGFGTVLPGECTGELSVLDHGAPPDHVAAQEDTDVLVIPADVLWRMVDECHGVARNMLRLLSFRLRAANAQLRRREKVGEFYRQLSMIDGLTGLHNRAWLNDRLPALIDHAHASREPLSLIMIDLDHFKRFNDEHGHQTGDAALVAAAKAISSVLRPSDFSARYGGEELTVLLPGTGAQAAKAVAQRLCEQLRETRVFEDAARPLPHVTASMGVATILDGEDADGLVTRADAALYRAKENGRNRVALA
ncbi:GGDEF domain-containing protein [Noviherbaspirillum galbum]|uniref:diguanylate cyclase n=1 Tax=Noviherbaspirillum galbum TaxID=2709383 RepID=A0A6B3SJ55_9BURK|nr:GGDEF domain-containing protein [Noviherbaspirillum galbum]NEX60753.1 GGDEF domain-containing protein [Noviherbaspirillum galbum]